MHNSFSAITSNKINADFWLPMIFEISIIAVKTRRKSITSSHKHYTIHLYRVKNGIGEGSKARMSHLIVFTAAARSSNPNYIFASSRERKKLFSVMVIFLPPRSNNCVE